ncbi:hypothetical protein ACFQ21_00120 [Ohtaekwangia kribbensis]|uniref:Uncharacterized protein n=1 Tax=Ohtaekwangia kribbensis TaxID=688913 RepID=A0ABW3JUR9_9BACT
MATKPFNSEEYNFNDLQVVMLGRPVAGLRGIRYKVSQDKTNVYGAGSKPIARRRGQKSYEGTLKILLSELRSLLESAGNGKDATDIPPFDITAAYAPSVSDLITTDRLVYVEFTECEIDINTGDSETVVELPIIIGDIEYNV